jgi:Holliday junction DNA helicase RuvB
MDYYTADDLFQILMRTAKNPEHGFAPDGAAEIAKRSRGTPRVANRILRRTRDYAQVKAAGVIDKLVADQS